MFDQRNRGKIKNSKIQAWRAELGMFVYEVKHRSGKENVAADALSRVCSVAGHPSSLKGLHESLGHPGITRLWHFVRSKNVPFPLEEVRQTCLNCHTCFFFSLPINDILQHSNHSWETILQCDEEVYNMKLCANLGLWDWLTDLFAGSHLLTMQKPEEMLRHRPFDGADFKVVWTLRTTWCSRTQRAARHKERYWEFALIIIREEVAAWVSEYSMQKTSVSAFMRKYCWHAVYWQNFADMILLQHHKIHWSLSSLKRKCGFRLKSFFKRCPSTTDPFFQARCATV